MRNIIFRFFNLFNKSDLIVAPSTYDILKERIFGIATEIHNLEGTLKSHIIPNSVEDRLYRRIDSLRQEMNDLLLEIRNLNN